MIRDVSGMAHPKMPFCAVHCLTLTKLWFVDMQRFPAFVNKCYIQENQIEHKTENSLKICLEYITKCKVEGKHNANVLVKKETSIIISPVTYLLKSSHLSLKEDALLST